MPVPARDRAVGPGRDRTSRTGAAARRRARPGPSPRRSAGPRRPIGRGGRPARGPRPARTSPRSRGGWSGPGRGRRRRRGRAAGPARSISSVRPASRVARVERRPAGRSASSSGSRSARRAPASIRLRSSRFVTSRLRCSASRSIACGARAPVLVRDLELRGRACVPAAARIDASGVRRSCETDSSSADLERVALAGDLRGRGLLGAGGPARAPGRSGRPRRRAAGSRLVRAGRRPGRGGPTASPASARRPRSSPGRRATPASRRSAGARLVDADPLGRGVAGHPTQHGVAGGR